MIKAYRHIYTPRVYIRDGSLYPPPKPDRVFCVSHLASKRCLEKTKQTTLGDQMMIRRTLSGEDVRLWCVLARTHRLRSTQSTRPPRGLCSGGGVRVFLRPLYPLYNHNFTLYACLPNKCDYSVSSSHLFPQCGTQDTLSGFGGGERPGSLDYTLRVYICLYALIKAYIKASLPCPLT